MGEGIVTDSVINAIRSKYLLEKSADICKYLYRNIIGSILI